MSLTINDSIKNLQIIIFNSSLSEKEKKLWSFLMSKITVEQASNIINVLKDKAENLQFLTKNIYEKGKALKNKDGKFWTSIIKEEVKVLKA